MKSLRDYKLQVESSAATSNRIAWGGPFPIPIHGTVNGMPARAIVPGDLPGASTVLLCTDPNGYLAEVKRTDFIVTDGAYLPLLDIPTPVERERTKAGK
jgi:hypothetical protein